MREKRTYETPVSEMVQIETDVSLMAASQNHKKLVVYDGQSNIDLIFGPATATDANPDDIDAKDNNNVWGENIWEE